MYELLWKIAFGVFLGALPLSMAHAIVLLTLRGAGREDVPVWLTWLRRAANGAIAIGLAALTGSIAARWVEAGYPPFSNMPESLLWMAWGFCCVYFVSRLFRDFPAMEAAACLGTLGILALSTLFDHAPRPLMPALQSNWLIFHVFTCMVSYSAFFAAFCAAILWLALWRKRESKRLLDNLSYQIMAFGFLLLTVGILSGAVWAKQAWGRYWGWDPKETWSLITWLVYGAYLHFRLVGPSFGVARDRMPLLNAIFALLGFAFVMFTYFGVSYLLPSLHSY